MRAYSDPSVNHAFPGEAGVVPPGTPVRAPDPAWIRADLAGLGAGVVLYRLERPQGATRITGAAGLTLAVRINLLAREPATGSAGPSSLKQCLAPDFYVLVPEGRTIVLGAHAGQYLLRLDVAPDCLDAIVGGPVSLDRLAGRNVADGFVTGLVERLRDDRMDSDDGSLNRSLLETLLRSLMAANAGTGASANRGGLTARQLSILREHVETRLHESLPNADLAALVDLSPFHFARAFKDSMGASPAAWIKLRRLTVGQRLLTDPARSISDIAAAVGYESPSRFASAFRRATGLTPSGYRRTLARATGEGLA